MLGQSYDLERLAARVGTGRATPRDLVALARTLALLPKVKARLTARVSKRLNQLEAALELCPEIRAEIEAALVDDPPLAVKEGGLIRDGYHPELDELRATARGGKSWIAKFQAEQIRRTGIPSLKVGYNKVFGYYIEITHAQAQARGSNIPSDYIRKQTVKNAERYITPELKEYEDKVTRAEERANELEYELFSTLRDRVSAEAPRLIQAGGVLAQLDVLTALAELAARHGYCRPEIVAEPVFEVEAGRHPVLDALLPPGDFVPNDVRLGPDDGTILLITGPNMAGKSTYIRQVALIAVLAQIGSFVPARAGADRGRRPALRPGRRHRRAEPRPEHVHGRDDRDGQHPEQRHAAEPGDPRRDRPRHEHVRRHLAGLGDHRAHPRRRRLPDAVRDPLPRAGRAGEDQAAAAQRQRRGARERGRDRLPAPDRARRGRPELRHPRGPAGGRPGPGAGAGPRDPQVPREAARARPRPGAPAPEGPIRRKVKTGRALAGSLFAELPDPLLVELRQVDPATLTPEQALDLVKRLRELAG